MRDSVDEAISCGVLEQPDPNEELHFATLSALEKAAKHLNDSEISLLCWHCGINRKELEE